MGKKKKKGYDFFWGGFHFPGQPKMLTRRVEKEIEDKIKGSFLTWDFQNHVLANWWVGGSVKNKKELKKGPTSQVLDDNSLE